MIRLLIVDDHKVVRQGLRFLLQHESDIEIVGEAADGEQAVAAVRQQVPTVVLLDMLRVVWVQTRPPWVPVPKARRAPLFSREAQA